MEVVEVSVGDLKPYERNPRDNSASVGYVMEIIKEFGFKVPIIAEEDGTIIAGHTRLEAAKALGMERVPVVYASDLTPEQAKAFRLATKVDFCIGFKEICDNVGIRYERVRECFISDPRVNPAHTFVYDEHPFWSSHCLDKDVPYAAYHLGNEQLRGVVERNEARKAIHKR